MQDNGYRRRGITPAGNMSDNVKSHNTLSVHSRSNISDDRTTRRSISDIRQRYCQLKQQEVENEWRIQEARDKQEARKHGTASPHTLEVNFEQNGTSGKINKCLNKIVKVNSTSGSVIPSGVKSAKSGNKVQSPEPGLKRATNHSTMMNSQYIRAEGEHQPNHNQTENRPCQHISAHGEMQPYNQHNLMSANATNIISVSETIKT